MLQLNFYINQDNSFLHGYVPKCFHVKKLWYDVFWGESHWVNVP